MIGSPDTGKTMLSLRLPTILPPLTPPESLETIRIYSALGRLKVDEPLLATRPFRDPYQVPGVQFQELSASADGTSSAMMREQVDRARRMQQARFGAARKAHQEMRKLSSKRLNRLEQHSARMPGDPRTPQQLELGFESRPL